MPPTVQRSRLLLPSMRAPSITVADVLYEHSRAAIACRKTEDKDKYALSYEGMLEGLD